MQSFPASRAGAPRNRLIAALAVLILAAVPALSSPAAAVDPDPTRIFPDPMLSTDFVQWSDDSGSTGPKYQAGIQELETTYDDIIDVDVISDLVDIPEAEALSVGDRPIHVITVTDEDVDAGGKVDLYISMSIHGLERAGLEGSVRFIEDIARGWTAEQSGGDDFILTNGDPKRPYYREMTATEVLKEARLVFVNLNPDGWAAGDLPPADSEGSFKRGNDHPYDPAEPIGPICCVDLNRQWPTLGYSPSGGIQYKTMAEPEARAGRKLIEEHLGVPEGAADLHGENEDNVLLAIMFPGGQFDPRGLAQQVELAESIKHNVNNSVFPGLSGGIDGANDEVYPAEYHTAYDAIGYDDGGFQGDYLVQQGILEMDHEYIFSNLAPGRAFVPALEQVHVDTTRELLKATIVTTIQSDKITYTADLEGRAAYVFNDKVLRHTDPGLPDPPFGFEQQPYASTSMQYYRDLAKYTTTPLEPIDVADVVDGAALKGLDTVVVTNRNGQPDAFWKSLRAFAEDGGNVVLTDAAMKGLIDLGIVEDGQVTRILQDAGKVENIDREHPLLEGVNGVFGQTYFEVSLGFPFDDHGDQSPAWFVDTEAWEAAGGTTAATAGDGTALGSMDVGKGTLSVFGAVLPDASQEYPHTQGLADYAVTYGANAVLVNALTYGQVRNSGGDRDGDSDSDDDGDGDVGNEDDDRTDDDGGPSLPATGGGLALLGIGALVAGTTMWRRRA